MFALTAITAVISALAAVLAYFDPNGDRARLAAARRELKRQGYEFRKGSEEEARAIRVLLDGDALQGA